MRMDSRASRPALKRISSGGVVLALVALFGLPTAAFAAPTTVTLAGNPGTVTITADGSDNAITVSSTALFVNVFDTKENVTPGAGCVVHPSDPEAARCASPSNGVTVINVTLGAGDDSIQAPAGTKAPAGTQATLADRDSVVLMNPLAAAPFNIRLFPAPRKPPRSCVPLGSCTGSARLSTDPSLCTAGTGRAGSLKSREYQNNPTRPLTDSISLAGS